MVSTPLAPRLALPVPARPPLPHWYEAVFHRQRGPLLAGRDQCLQAYFGRRPPRGPRSSYRLHLREGSKVRQLYGGLPRGRLARLLQTAVGTPGGGPGGLLALLESRLDVVVVRSGLLPTLETARQWIRHGHLLVNRQVATRAGRPVRPGDLVALHPAHRHRAWERPRDLVVRSRWRVGPARGPRRPVAGAPARGAMAGLRWGVWRRLACHVTWVCPPLAGGPLPTPGLWWSTPRERDPRALVPTPHGLRRLTRWYGGGYLLGAAWSRGVYGVHRRTWRSPDLGTRLQRRHERRGVWRRYGRKPLHLEVSYPLGAVVALYRPQRVWSPLALDLDVLHRALA
jgi:hypothetical protein